MSIKDIRGNVFHVGCEIVRAVGDGYLSFHTVTRIENGRLYLDTSKIAIRYPNRLLIIKSDPLFTMVKTYTDTK